MEQRSWNRLGRAGEVVGAFAFWIVQKDSRTFSNCHEFGIEQAEIIGIIMPTAPYIGVCFRLLNYLPSGDEECILVVGLRGLA